MSAQATTMSVLNYLITKATLDGASKSAKIRIPYPELAASVGKVIEKADYDVVDLVIEINLFWEEGDAEGIAVEMDEEDAPNF